MIINFDSEPPSSPKETPTKTDKLISATESLIHKAFLQVKKAPYFVKLGLKLFKDLFNNSRLMPHFAISSLLIVVVFANFAQKSRAEALASQLIPLDPAMESAIVDNIDQFTPIINNDAVALDQLISSKVVTDGFAQNVAPVYTQLTERTEPFPDNSTKDVAYIVRPGDTLLRVGNLFGVGLPTLKYVNNLTNDIIKPGDKLAIPKRGYQVSSSQLAKRKAEQDKKKLASARNTVARDSSTRSTVNTRPGSSKNGYPYGWCTYYVATRRFVPSNWGNARTWLSSARRAGYATGSTPAAGAIVQTSESWLGHVAYVESVNGDGTFTISEMNAIGWGKTSSRKMSVGSGKIVGFIY